MCVVRTPTGVLPINYRYVYKRNTTFIKKVQGAVMVALAFGQVPGVDVFNTFGPVVWSITLRLLPALVFLYIICMCINLM